MFGPEHRTDIEEIKTAALAVLVAQAVVAATVGLFFALVQ